MNRPTDVETSQRPFPLIIVVGLAAVVNFIVAASISPSDPGLPLAVLYGLVLAQVGLLSAWAVLGPHRIGVQWPASLLILVGLVVMICLGTAAGNPRSDLRSALRSMLGLPLLFAMAQLPLWILRLVAGWRIVPSGAAETITTRGPRQFGVQDLLGVTAAVALILGLAQFGLFYGADLAASDILAVWAMGLGFGLALAVISTFFVPLGIWAGLGVRDLLSAAFELAFWGTLLFLAAFIVAQILSPGGFPSKGLNAILLFVTVSLGLIFGVLRLAHSCSYVLITTWRRKREASVLDGQGAVAMEANTTDTEIPRVP